MILFERRKANCNQAQPQLEDLVYDFLEPLFDLWLIESDQEVV